MTKYKIYTMKIVCQNCKKKFKTNLFTKRICDKCIEKMKKGE